MPSLFTELRRRNVFKVGAAYAIVAWLLIQIADVVLPALGAPEWTISFVAVLFILGFPITLIMAWAYEMTPEGIKAAASVQPTESITRATGQMLNAFIVGLLTLAVGFLVVDQYVLEPRASLNSANNDTADATMDLTPSSIGTSYSSASAEVRRFAINLGPSEGVGNTGLSAHMALSPDGTELVYAVEVNSITQLYHRSIDQFDPRPLPGTDGAESPFFSPDGNWVAFYTDETDQELKKVAIQGGFPQTLADAQFAGGGFWLEDDTILYSSQDASGGRSLFSIPASGGTPEVVLPSHTEGGYIGPEVLPGGRAVLFVIRHGAGGGGNARDAEIAVLSLETGEVTSLIERGYGPRYAPTGHIIFAREGALRAVPFDPVTLATTGPEVLVVQGVQQDGVRGGVPYAFSNTGMLTYLPGGDTGAWEGVIRNLVWVTQDGLEEPVDTEPRRYSGPRISPDGKRLATAIFQQGSWDIWVDDFVRGTSSRLTFDTENAGSPLWTPDGNRIIFSSRDGNGPGLFSKQADGTGSIERLTTNPSALTARAFLPASEQLIVEQVTPRDILMLSLTDTSDLRPLLDSDFMEQDAVLSPDGDWLAYTSDESGPYEIYVRSFPDVEEGKWQVSRNGGIAPRWAPDGRGLFFINSDEDENAIMMIASVETDQGFSAGNSRELFRGNYAVPRYGLSSDGQRFLMMKDAEEAAQVRQDVYARVVDNWFSELNRLAPPTDGE